MKRESISIKLNEKELQNLLNNYYKELNMDNIYSEVTIENGKLIVRLFKETKLNGLPVREMYILNNEDLKAYLNVILIKESYEVSSVKTLIHIIYDSKQKKHVPTYSVVAKLKSKEKNKIR